MTETLTTEQLQRKIDKAEREADTYKSKRELVAHVTLLTASLKAAKEEAMRIEEAYRAGLPHHLLKFLPRSPDVQVVRQEIIELAAGFNVELDNPPLTHNTEEATHG